MRGPRPGRRLDFVHIEHALLGSDDNMRRRSGQQDLNMPVLISYIAERTGLPRETIYRYRKQGVTLHGADKIAIALDRHPAELWPDYYGDMSCHT